jgi:uncharacterized membrane protein
MNPLDQLKNIHLPAQVSMWPLAWPWWVLLAVIITTIILAIYLKRKNAWRKQALLQLNTIDSANKMQCIQDCNRLLKQVAQLRFGQQCAALSGQKWLDFLDSKVKQAIFNPSLTPFANAPDQVDTTINPVHVKQAVALWIRKHSC